MCESPQQFNDTAFVQGVSIRSCTFVPYFIVMTSFVKDKLCLSCIDFLSILCYLIDTERVSPMNS